MMMKVSLIVALVVLVADSAFSACPDGWESFSNKCYLFSNGTGTWMEAKQMCEWHRSDLIEIESAEEQAFFKNKAETYNHTFEDDGFWLGATDFLKEGVWVWETSKQNLAGAYEVWGQDQPNNRDNRENCLAAVKYFDYIWSDEFCDWSHHIQYVCEKPARAGPIVG